MSKHRPFHAVKPKTKNQARFIKQVYDHEMVVSHGPAGVGKTFLAAALAAQFYHEKKVDRIVLTRPALAVGGKSQMGFLPGTLEEKLQPWTAPFVKVLEDFLSKGEVECMCKNEKLIIIPFDTLRGHTFNNSFVILDEAQNTTVKMMQAFLTRTGENSKTVIDGDLYQSDLPHNEMSGLEFILDLLSDENNKELYEAVGQVEFDEEDVVRSGLCKLLVKAINGYGT